VNKLWIVLLLSGVASFALAAGKPPPRSRADVQHVLASSHSLPPALQPLRLCLVASKQDHGPGEHDYPAWQTNWTKLLAKSPAVTVSTAWKWPDTFTNIDVVVCYFWNHDWSTNRLKQLDDFLARGGGVVLLHSATIADKEPETLARRIGLAYQPGRSKYRHGPLDLQIVAPTDESITGALPRKIHFVDESYWPFIGDTNNVRVLATTKEEGNEWPMIWTFQPAKGRVFGSVVGHYAWSYDDPFFRLIVLRAIAWAANQPVARLEHLATDGVTLTD
jgi:type 1 glutamine amidotransferase